MTPFRVPVPTIWPPSEMPRADFRIHPEPAGIIVFKSVIAPFRHRNACAPLPLVSAVPTTSPRVLTSKPSLFVPPSVPRSVITPFEYRNACLVVWLASAAVPAICSA